MSDARDKVISTADVAWNKTTSRADRGRALKLNCFVYYNKELRGNFEANRREKNLYGSTDGCFDRQLQVSEFAVPEDCHDILKVE